MLDSSLVGAGGGVGAFCGFCECNTCASISSCLHKKDCVYVQTDIQDLQDRRLMETTCPLFKTPGAGAPMCSSILHIDAWRVEKNYSSSVHFYRAISKQDRQAPAESVFVFPSGSPCHILECIPPQSRLCSRMTFQQLCHFY